MSIICLSAVLNKSTLLSGSSQFFLKTRFWISAYYRDKSMVYSFSHDFSLDFLWNPVPDNASV